jgi:hypothetical protein
MHSKLAFSSDEHLFFNCPWFAFRRTFVLYAVLTIGYALEISIETAGGWLVGSSNSPISLPREHIPAPCSAQWLV